MSLQETIPPPPPLPPRKLLSLWHLPRGSCLLYFTCHMALTPELSWMFFHSTRSARRWESCWVPPCGWTNIACHSAAFHRLLLCRVAEPTCQLTVSCAKYLFCIFLGSSLTIPSNNDIGIIRLGCPKNVDGVELFEERVDHPVDHQFLKIPQRLKKKVLIRIPL